MSSEFLRLRIAHLDDLIKIKEQVLKSCMVVIAKSEESDSSLIWLLRNRAGLSDIFRVNEGIGVRSGHFGWLYGVPLHWKRGMQEYMIEFVYQLEE